jgi:hypothetical protein
MPDTTDELVQIELTISQWISCQAALLAVAAHSSDPVYAHIQTQIDAQVLLAIDLRHGNADLL